VAVTASASNARQALDAAVDAMRAVQIEDPRLDAEVLLAEASGIDRTSLVADPAAEVSPAAARLFGEMVRRRLRREPVAYIVGHKGFRHLDLQVDRRVLIPRPETELLVEIALERSPASVLDLGTGSGAIALALADELPSCEVTASDTSARALEVARANGERLGLGPRVHFVEASIPAGEQFDLVLANLPYVAERDWSGLQREVTEWEPREALLAGPDGLDAYRALFEKRGRRLSPTGLQVAIAVALEVGEGQAQAVASMVREAGFGSVETRCDLAGIERVVIGAR
jgi:release factor glutamine methyltransferase